MSEFPPRPSLDDTANQLVGMVGVQNERLAENNAATAENTAAIADLTDATRHNRWWIRVLIVSLIFDVLITVALGFLYNDNRTALRAACREGNLTRAGSTQLWESVVSDQPATTAEQKARTDQFLAKLHEVYAPRHCG